MTHPYLLDPPHVLDYAGVKWGLVHLNRSDRKCEQCGRALRKKSRAYRTRAAFAGNPGGDEGQTFMHQKCLIGQIWPEVWDIPIGGSG